MVMDIYAKTYRIIIFNYVQFTECQLFLNKAISEKKEEETRRRDVSEILKDTTEIQSFIQ